MRLDINLASQPYEDARRFWLRWGTALVAAAALTLFLLAATFTGWFNARRDRVQIADLRAQIAGRDQVRQRAQDFLDRPENRTTRDESQFLNDLIDRKSFSWTHVLEDLEKVMPARLHLVSIHPELDQDNQLKVKMSVAGESRERAIELARRMEDSRRFSQTYIDTETTDPTHPGDTVLVGINAIYIPQTETAATPASAPSPTPKKQIAKGVTP
jgi:type IV pilus assembly protein PilN